MEKQYAHQSCFEVLHKVEDIIPGTKLTHWPFCFRPSTNVIETMITIVDIDYVLYSLYSLVKLEKRTRANCETAVTVRWKRAPGNMDTGRPARALPGLHGVVRLHASRSGAAR